MAQRVHQLALAALLAGSAVMLSGCQKPAADLMADARSYQQKGDKKAAQIQLKNLLDKEPDNAEARYLLADISLSLGDVQAAEKEVRRAIALKYKPDESLALLVKVLMNQGQYQKVLDETAKVKDKPAIQAMRGDALIGLRKLDDAKAEFQAALKADPDNADALTGLAREAALNKDIAEATRLNEEALTKDANNVLALNLRAELLQTQNKPGEARQAYEAILKLQPDNQNAHIQKAFVEMSEGKLDAAQSELDAARKGSDKTPPWIYAQALVDFAKGNFKSARDRLNILMKIAPEHPPGMLLAGATNFQLGSLEQAETYTRSYVERDSHNLYARKLLAAIRLRAGDPAQAIMALGPFLGAKEADVAVLQLAGEAMTQQKDFAKAAGYLQQAVTRDPNNPSLHTELGMARLAMGDRASAISELERGVALDPKSLQAGLSLARARLSLRQPDKALAAVQALDASHKDNVLILNTRGVIELAKHDYPAAKASFDKALKADPHSFPALLNLARLDVRDKNLDGASKRLEGYLATDKDNVEVMTVLAQFAEDRSQWDQARSWLAKASAAKPEALQPALRLARFDLIHGKPAEAVITLRKLQTTNAENPVLLDLLSGAEQATGQLPQALETMSKLAAVAPKFGMPQYRMAVINLQMRNLPAAQRAVDKAIAVEPTYYPALMMQAELAMARGEIAKVAPIYRNLQKQYPKNPAAFVAEGDLQMNSRHAAQAVPLFEQAFKLAPVSAILVKLTDAMGVAGQAKEADARLAQWRKDHPNDPELSFHAAEIHISKKEFKEAIVELESTVKVQPMNAAAWNNLAYSYQQVKDPRALDTAERAATLAGSDPAVLDTLGWLLIEQGKLDRGVQVLRKASDIVPQAGDVRYHLAFGLNRAGDKTQARKELRLALANGNNFVLAEDARALLKQIE